jgi:predicted nucleic acid-binding Zn ribbon protein
MNEAVEYYRHLKELYGTDAARGAWRRARQKGAAPRTGPETSVPFGAGRDPRDLGGVLDALTDELGWRAPLAESELLVEWPDLVGPDTAAHAMAVEVDGGVLTVRCDSTAWATQLRLMRGELLVRIAREHPHAGVESIRFLGPDVPSWKRGPRSVPGRGPRDTYG